MLSFLASAQAPDRSSSTLVIVLVAAGLILLICGLAFLPVCVAWARRSRHAEGILAVAILWGLVSAATLMNLSISQINWSREQMIRIQSGYFDPSDTSDRPTIPWKLWLPLIVLYFVMLAVSLRRSAVPRPRARNMPTGKPKPLPEEL